MNNRWSIVKRIHAYWIAARESWKLAGMATMSSRDREKYAERHALPGLKQQTIAAALELSIRRRPYNFSNALIDAAIARQIPELPALDRA